MDVDRKKNLILEDSQDYKCDLRKDDSDERLAKLGESAWDSSERPGNEDAKVESASLARRSQIAKADDAMIESKVIPVELPKSTSILFQTAEQPGTTINHTDKSPGDYVVPVSVKLQGKLM